MTKTQARIMEMVHNAVERSRLSSEPLPVIVVGGGSVLIDDKIGDLEVVKPHHFACANAVGAAIAQVSGEVDRIYMLSKSSRDEALADAKQKASDAAVAAGARADSVAIVDVEDVPLAYIPGNATRMRVKAVGELESLTVSLRPSGSTNDRRPRRRPGSRTRPGVGLPKTRGGKSKGHVRPGRPANGQRPRRRRMIDVADLDDIAVGGAILGTGGGGDPYIGKLMAQQAIRKYGPVRMIDVDEIEDDDLSLPCAMMGAPTVMVEKIPQGGEILDAFRKLERFLGKKIGAMLCAEAGGLNSTIPFVIGAMTGIPVIDGDGMGRAYPELQMVTFTMHGVSATPMVVVDDKGNSILLECIDNRWTERLARTATIEMGGSVLIALYPMTGAVAKKASVRGTLTLARRLGEILRESRAAHADAVAAIQSKLSAAHHLRGPRDRHRAAHRDGVCARRGQIRRRRRVSRPQIPHRVPERVPDRRARRRADRHDA